MNIRNLSFMSMILCASPILSAASSFAPTFAKVRSADKTVDKPEVKLTKQEQEANKLKSMFEYARLGNNHMLNVLFEAGANVNQQGEFGSTLLHVASEHGHINTVQFLLDSGAKVNQGNIVNYTALHAASAKGHIDIVKLLIAQGADVNKTTKPYGSGCCQVGGYRSPLSEAAENGHMEIVKILLKAGAHVPSDLAWRSKKNGYTEIAKLLERYY